MPNFKVLMTRDATESVLIEVEADNSADAELAAKGYIENTEDPIDWQADDAVNGEMYPTNVQEVDEHEQPPEWTINVAMDIRAYGCVKVRAPNADAAVHMVTAELVADRFEPHGSSEDLDYTMPRSIWLDVATDENGDDWPIELDLKDGPWVE